MRFCGYFLGFLLSAVNVTAADPVLWLDAGNRKSFTFGEEQIRSWRDSNGKAISLSQGRVDYRPELRGKLNGRSTLYFDGADFLAGPPVLEEGDDTFTFVVLWRPFRDGVQAVFEQAGQGTGRRASLLQVKDRYGFNGQSNDAHSLVPVKPKGVAPDRPGVERREAEQRDHDRQRLGTGDGND